MPNYYFIVQWPDMRLSTPSWTILPNDKAAIKYAHLIIRELKRVGGHDDPRLTLLVQNSEGKTTSSIPFGR
jgi:hypothetical protein